MIKTVFSELLYAIIEKFDLDKSMYIDYSEFHLFDGFLQDADLILTFQRENIGNANYVTGDPFISLDGITNKYDLIIGDHPLGLYGERFQDTSTATT